MFCGEVVPQWRHAGGLVEYNLLPSIALAANLLETQTTNSYSIHFGSNMITISKQDKKISTKKLKQRTSQNLISALLQMQSSVCRILLWLFVNATHWTGNESLLVESTEEIEEKKLREMCIKNEHFSWLFPLGGWGSHECHKDFLTFFCFRTSDAQRLFFKRVRKTMKNQPGTMKNRPPSKSDNFLLHTRGHNWPSWHRMRKCSFFVTYLHGVTTDLHDTELESAHFSWLTYTGSQLTF